MGAEPSARHRVDAILARLDARRDQERVFTRIYPETARAEADASDARQRTGQPLGPLDGRIVSIKDLFDVAGEPTTAGSAMRRTSPPALHDAPVVARLRKAGAVIIGKTNMTEFAFTAVGFNPHHGMPPNAHDPLRIPGGSSSGAAVSVAEGTSEIAIGSDTGGSVRIPAALNGVVGFKPTARRVPREGAVALSPTLDSIGPLALTVADCALADAIMAGETPAPIRVPSLSELTLAVARGRPFDAVERDVAAGFDRSIAALVDSGARIGEVSIDDLLAEMRGATRAGSIASVEAAEIHADWLLGETAGADPRVVDPRVVGPLTRRLGYPAWSYIRMMRRRAELAAAMDARLALLDAILLPTVPILAPLASEVEAEDLYDRAEGLLLRNTQIANQFDLCAISLPMPGMALPGGLMLLGRHGEDRRLLAVALAVEEALRAA